MFIHRWPHSRSVTMPLLGSALVWLAPMGVLLAWSFGQWREKHPGVPFTDHLRADPHICALIILQICLWFIPLGMWLILLGFTLTSLILAGPRSRGSSGASAQRRGRWRSSCCWRCTC